MIEDELKNRMQRFAVEVVRLVNELPKKQSAGVLGKQLLRCGTSIGANYRAACRAKSKADFIAKLAIVEEEADEAIYWLELLVSTDIAAEESVGHLIEEASEFVAIAVSSIKTMRGPSLAQSKIQIPKSKF